MSFCCSELHSTKCLCVYQRLLPLILKLSGFSIIVHAVTMAMHVRFVLSFQWVPCNGLFENANSKLQTALYVLYRSSCTVVPRCNVHNNPSSVS